MSDNNATSMATSSTPLPWQPYDETLRTMEMMYLIILMIGGTCGNILVICSIVHEKRVSRSGNIFIINLACADLLATGCYVPTMLANVVQRGRNALGNPFVLCEIAGYGITLCCACSIQTLSVISVNRYMAVVRNNSYKKLFSKYFNILWVLWTWIWPNVLMVPTLYGDWSGIGYDAKIMECMWDDAKSQGYNAFFMTLAIFVPLCVIGVCYFRLYRFVQQKSKELLVVTNSTVRNRHHNHSIRLLQREMTLIRTLAVAVLCFIICWTPYGLVVIIDPIYADKHLKKVVGWLGVSNSAANFIIYGLLSPTYRLGYANFIKYLFTGGNPRRRTNNLAATFTGNHLHRTGTSTVKIASQINILRHQPKHISSEVSSQVPSDDVTINDVITSNYLFPPSAPNSNHFTRKPTKL